eukprot:3012011-Ditylum_brightwellii.AAC.1
MREIGHEQLFCTFLGEKWFYTTSRCKKIKFLSSRQGENPGIAKKKHSQMISRRHPVNVMYMGVFAPLSKSKDIDGKIFFKYVNQKKETQKENYNQHFSDNGVIHTELKDGKWKYWPIMLKV